MSSLIVNSLISTTRANNIISVASTSTLKFPGAIVQTKYVRSDNRTTYSSAASGNGTSITDLNLVITPKFDSSIMWITWMINGEIGENNVFLVHQDSALITTSGYAGYNATVGNNRWTGFVSAKYDTDVNSTPQNYNIQYYIPAASTSSRTYAPAIRSANGTAQTFYLNRAVGAVGQDNYENMISTGVVMEIAQ